MGRKKYRFGLVWGWFGAGLGPVEQFIVKKSIVLFRLRAAAGSLMCPYFLLSGQSFMSYPCSGLIFDTKFGNIYLI